MGFDYTVTYEVYVKVVKVAKNEGRILRYTLKFIYLCGRA